MKRRNFLFRSVTGLAMLGWFGFTLPALPKTRLEQDAGRYFEGTIAADARNQFTVATRDNQIVKVMMTAATDVWEGRWVKDIPEQVGDKITALGTYHADGTFIAEKLWINLVNLVGPASSIQQNRTRRQPQIRFNCDDRYLGKQPVCIMPETLIGTPALREKRPFKDTPIRLRAGQTVEVIGRRTRGVVLATDVLLDA